MTSNPPIPTRPCFACGRLTSETQSVHGVGHLECFRSAKPPGLPLSALDQLAERTRAARMAQIDLDRQTGPAVATFGPGNEHYDAMQDDLNKIMSRVVNNLIGRQQG